MVFLAPQAFASKYLQTSVERIKTGSLSCRSRQDLPALASATKVFRPSSPHLPPFCQDEIHLRRRCPRSLCVRICRSGIIRPDLRRRRRKHEHRRLLKSHPAVPDVRLLPNVPEHRRRVRHFRVWLSELWDVLEAHGQRHREDDHLYRDRPCRRRLQPLAGGA